MGTNSLYALDVRLLRARPTARRDHRASLDPVDLAPRTFILVLAAMTVSVVLNHLFEVQIVVRR
jgi:hypothetical protein